MSKKTFLVAFSLAEFVCFRYDGVIDIISITIERLHSGTGFTFYIEYLGIDRKSCCRLEICITKFTGRNLNTSVMVSGPEPLEVTSQD